ncbi:MAG: NAD-dependent epimerase/dehydratase family protein [Spirochaetaceae bacterium]|nr:MAG: NAD-dependent epimerase/dehydratase family protein [Spirochaetaceae bacterium]
MRITVIGATGHVGSYLVPRLVELGHEVTAVSRGRREAYKTHAAWKQVRRVILDREALESDGRFADRILALSPEIVIDMICFTAESARHLVEALNGALQHYLACGTIWVHGYSTIVPATESLPRKPFGEYGIRKEEMERYLLEQARLRRFPATVLHPGHIVGEGWPPLNPAGNFNPSVFEILAREEELVLPNLGLETVHHVHADDVAQGFVKAIGNWSTSVGESFHLVSPAALTLRGYAEHMAAWFGMKPNIRFLPWEQWKETVSEEEAWFTWDHIAHSPNCSIEKAKRLLNYAPRYGSLEAVCESVRWLIEHDLISV